MNTKEKIKFPLLKDKVAKKLFTEKITKRFDSINKVDLEALKTDEK